MPACMCVFKLPALQANHNSGAVRWTDVGVLRGCIEACVAQSARGFGPGGERCRSCLGPRP
eukprot:5416336-Alexandrium_andersonii.AAC.1